MDEMDIDETDDSDSRNDIESWVQWYQKQIELNPKSTMAHYKLGQLFARLERYQEAIDQWKTVIAIDSNHLAARQVLQEISSRLRVKKKASYQSSG